MRKTIFTDFFPKIYSIKHLIKRNIRLFCGGLTVAIVLSAPFPYFTGEGVLFMPKKLISTAHAAETEETAPLIPKIETDSSADFTMMTNESLKENESEAPFPPVTELNDPPLNPFLPLHKQIEDTNFLTNNLSPSSPLSSALSSETLLKGNPIGQELLEEEKVLELIPLNHIPADYMAKELNSIFPRSNIRCDIYSNSLIFYGEKSNWKKTEKLLQKLDKAKKQIRLEAIIIALHKGKDRDLGIKWNWDQIPSYAENNKEYQGHIRFGKRSSARFDFTSTLKSLISSGQAKILASPGLVTIPGKKASIFIGSQIPVVTEKYSNKGESTYSTEYVDAGITLSFLPLLSSKGLITADVNTEVSTPSMVPELKNYRINSRSAETTVRMHDGETIFIGGLISEEEQKRMEKIPLLCKLPLLGHLFTHKYIHKENTEIIILLTPHIK